MADVSIYYSGNSRFTITHPERGAQYQFQYQVKNLIDEEIWGELIAPGGPAYAHRKRFRKTSMPGPGDRSHRVTPVKMPPRQPRLTPAERVAASRDVSAAKDAEIARLNEQIALLMAEREERLAGGDGASADDDGPGDVDPSKLGVSKLTEAIAGKGLTELDQVLEAEKAGKGRAGAIKAIEAEMERAMEREET